MIFHFRKFIIFLFLCIIYFPNNSLKKIYANNINYEENLILNNELDTNNKVNTTINNDKRIYSINKSVYI